ncbi:hypothetical protein GMRT_15575 [Giardia muris]|uniref:Uncharacterized protein n=1 Tax=Giardia muris TaxID=5742 RepID=A0A4Z1T4B7_GIAMU|nr:hypothetical protein GMRT_15575 [Giardia muris]|eukprot:TNJ28833.1 hypothetical protein GMRT_15575 [Giardia muris]
MIALLYLSSVSVMMSACMPISSVEELQSLSERPSGEYCLTSSLTMMDWSPIPHFAGILNGKGHMLTMTLPKKELLAGVFARLSGSVLNLQLDILIPGKEAMYSGGLAAICDGCTVTNVRVRAVLDALAERGSGYLFGLVLSDYPTSSVPFQDVYLESVSPSGLPREGLFQYLDDEAVIETPDIVPLKKDRDDFDYEELAIGLTVFFLIVILAIVLCVIFVCGCCCTTCCCCTCPLGLLQKRSQRNNRSLDYSSGRGSIARIHEPGYEVTSLDNSMGRSLGGPQSTDLTKFPLPQTRMLH